MPTSHRFQSLEQRDINKETFVEPWPEAGLIVADSPTDPARSLRLAAGQVVELDGRARAADCNLSPSPFVEINDPAPRRPLPKILRDFGATLAQCEKTDVELDRILVSLGLNDRESL